MIQKLGKLQMTTRMHIQDQPSRGCAKKAEPVIIFTQGWGANPPTRELKEQRQLGEILGSSVEVELVTSH